MLGAFALTAAAFSSPMRAIRSLPDTARSSSKLPGAAYTNSFFNGAQTASAQFAESLADANGRITYRLFGVLPLRTVQLVSDETVLLTPGGTAVGITIRTEGVLIVGLGSVDTPDGPVSPAAASGLTVGDVILSVNGQTLSGGDQLSDILKSCRGTLQLSVLRGTQLITLSAMPANASDGSVRLGAWVRDSTAGVGTISFYDGVTKRYAALGHAVSDVDTHTLISIREGRLLPSEIVSIVPGSEGAPGELTGAFSVSGDALGTIDKNTEYGIYGRLFAAYENGFCSELPLALPGEAHTGGATLLTTISDGGVRPFTCEITRVSAQTAPAPKGLVVEITDPALIAATGGIVQGMSGSPVLQDGKLVGVITHVFVNDPLKGYCVYAKWMFDRMNEAS